MVASPCITRRRKTTTTTATSTTKTTTATTTKTTMTTAVTTATDINARLDLIYYLTTSCPVASPCITRRGTTTTTTTATTVTATTTTVTTTTTTTDKYALLYPVSYLTTSCTVASPCITRRGIISGPDAH